VKLDYNAISVPITYQWKDGKQYVAIVADDGGAGVTDPRPANNGSLVVFALP
jgi:glucose dehydrogenase